MKRRCISLMVTICFLAQQAAFSQTMPIPQPPADMFRPVHLRSLSFQPSVPSVELVLDSGERIAAPAAARASADILMEYFLVGLSLPNDVFWVNLRPDSPHEIIDPRLEKTEVGRIMLEADVQLKKDLAGLTSLDTQTGRRYWEQLYAKAGQLFSGDTLEIPALTRPWIVPGEVIIAQTPNGAYIYKATLSVMLEQDYLKDQQASFADPRMKELNDYSSQLVRTLLLPQLVRQVNTARRYAQLRQVYYSLVLAQWFKQRYAGQRRAGAHPLIERIDSFNLKRLTSKTAWSKMTYFKAYETSFSKGEYRKEEQLHSASGTVVRTYFSGGAVINAQQALRSPGAVVNAVNGRIPPGADSLRFTYDLSDRDGGKTVSVSRVERDVQVKVGTSGWRARMDTGEFTADNVGRLAKAIALVLLEQVASGDYVPNNGEALRVLVAYDARKGGREFAQRIVEVLAANGIEADIGSEYATTPAVIAQTRESLGEKAYDLALHVTASHNDVRYNGIKFLQNGVVAPDSLTGQFAARANDETSNADYRMIPFEQLQVKQVDIIEDTIARYRQTFPELVAAVKAYRASHPDFDLVVDILHGSAGPYVRLFEEMGAKIVRTAPMREGTYPRETFLEDGEEKLYRPEPKELFLDKQAFETFSTTAADGSMYIGIDGDGDRAAVWVKKAGRAVEFAPNKLGPLYAWYLLSSGRTTDAACLAKTLPTTYAMDVLAKKYGLPLYVTPVGSKHFAPYMRDSSGEKAAVVFEESGHAGLRIGTQTWFDDATTQALLMLEIVAHYQADLVSVMGMSQEAIGYASVDKRVNKDLTEELKEKIRSPLLNDPAGLALRIEKAVGARAEDISVTTSDDRVVPLETLINDKLKINANEGMHLQFVFPQGVAWVQVRLSSTEPVARLYTEAANDRLRQTLENAVSTALGIEQTGAVAASEDEELSTAESARLARIEPAVRHMIAAGLFGEGLSAQQQDELVSLFNEEIGAEGPAARLGWVIPPSWKEVETVLQRFLDLKAVKGKKNFVFSGMGGSINTVKAVNTLMHFLAQQGLIASDYRIYTIDNPDGAAMQELLGTLGDEALRQTLVVGISKSVTTQETQALLKTLREKFLANQLALEDHFLWMIDEENKANMAKTGWSADTATMPIQVDGETDIGGRFTAPHTLIYLIPALLMLNGDMDAMQRGWENYLTAVSRLQGQAAAKADEAYGQNAQRFALVVKDRVVARALRTWVVQLVEESLGSKKEGFDPKTVVITEDQTGDFKDFYQIRFDLPGTDLVTDMMLNMYFSQLFVALLARHQRINFVVQDAVKEYKKGANDDVTQAVPRGLSVSLENIADYNRQLWESKEFIEPVFFGHLTAAQREYIETVLKRAFPSEKLRNLAFFFEGPDWNHHSFQAAFANKDTYFLLLTKPDYMAEIPGISAEIMAQNAHDLQDIVFRTYNSIQDKAGYFEINDSGLWESRDGGDTQRTAVAAPKTTGGVDLRAVPVRAVSAAAFPVSLNDAGLAVFCRDKRDGKPCAASLEYVAGLLRQQEETLVPAAEELKQALAYLSS